MSNKIILLNIKQWNIFKYSVFEDLARDSIISKYINYLCSINSQQKFIMFDSKF